MQGAGNDFIIISNIEEGIPVEELGKLAKKLCSRRFSIGADGMMVVDKPSNDGDYMMRFYNSDGSIGEMCGNGARCVARYGYENGLAGKTQKIETGSGLVIGNRVDDNNYQVKLNDVTKIETKKAIFINSKEYIVTYVELGVPGLPHLACHIHDLGNINRTELKELARKMRSYKDFPKGANVNFYDFLSENHLLELTYERGVEDFTYACGTGTAATVIALTALGQVTGKDIRVSMDGGELNVDLRYINGKFSNILLTGPAKTVVKGEIVDL